jgi:hypothetical protein
LIGAEAIESNIKLEGRPSKWGKGGKSSPFEKFRNPNSDQEATEEEEEPTEEEQ